MGQKASDFTHVNASPDVILDVITDLPAYPEWADGVKEVEVHESDDQGRPRKATFQVDARVMHITYTLAYQYGDNKVTWELIEGSSINQLDGEYDLTDEGGSTKVTYSLEVDVDLPLPGFMKKRAAKTILETGLKGLKQRAEARA